MLRAPLLPKLRGHFAEFLRESYLAPLGILYQPTCVGFRYRYFLSWNVVRAFLGSMTARKFSPRKVKTYHFLTQNSFSSSSQRLESFHQNPNLASLCLLRPSVPTKSSTGILTCLPSATPFGLTLGPDSPSMDEPSGGILRFTGHWILTNVCVTQADILTSASSTPVCTDASPVCGTLPYRCPSGHPTASADRLVPFIFGARALDQ